MKSYSLHRHLIFCKYIVMSVSIKISCHYSEHLFISGSDFTVYAVLQLILGLHLETKQHILG